MVTLTQTQVTTKPIVFSSGINVGPTFVRQGPSYTDDRIISIIGYKGPVYYVLTDYFDNGYPYRRGYNKVVILVTPETEYVIIRIRRVDDTCDPVIDETEYIVYVKNFGWWLFTKNDAIKLNPMTQQEIAKTLEREEPLKAHIGFLF